MRYCFQFMLALLVVVAALSATTAEDQPNISMEIADRAKYDELLATKQGKVVLVDFWATWCAPCIKQFSHTVELDGKYSDDLAVISVSMDEPEDKDRVLEFLTLKKATFDNLLSTYGVGQKGFEAFELGDAGVPHYKLYDRKGQLRHTVTDAKEVDALLQALVEEK